MKTKTVNVPSEYEVEKINPSNYRFELIGIDYVIKQDGFTACIQNLGELYIAKDLNLIIGVAVTGNHWMYKNMLELVYVQEKYRNKGVGKRLVEEVLKDQTSRITAEPFTKQGLKLLESAGFKIIDNLERFSLGDYLETETRNDGVIQDVYKEEEKNRKRYNYVYKNKEGIELVDMDMGLSRGLITPRYIGEYVRS